MQDWFNANAFNKINKNHPDYAKKKKFLEKKYTINFDNMSTADETFMCGKCLVCNDPICKDAHDRFIETGEAVKPEKAKAYAKLINEHYREVHGNTPPTDKAIQELAKFEKAEELAIEEDNAKLLSEYSNYVKVAGEGEVEYKGRECKFTNYKCLICKNIFATDIKAMCLHVDAHNNNEVIKWGKVKSGKFFKGNLRPEQHIYDKNLSKFTWGSDCNIAHISYPSAYRVSPPDEKRSTFRIFCKKCDKFHIEVEDLDPNTNLDSKAKKAGFMRHHEEACLGDLD